MTDIEKLIGTKEELEAVEKTWLELSAVLIDKAESPDKKVEFLLDRGDFFEETMRDTEKAVETYKEVLKIDKNHPIKKRIEELTKI